MKFVDDLPKCPFCDSGDLSSRLVCKWEGVHLVSDAHPVVFGHLLGVSERHHLSFGEVNVGTLVNLRSKIIETSKHLATIKPRVVLFERGNKTINKSGKPSVDHAHFHLIPTEDVRPHLPATKRNASFLDLPNYISECSYYFYWDIFDDVAYWGNAEDVESQFIRKIVATGNDMTDWNWRNTTSGNGHAEEQSRVIKTLLERNPK
ncbi:MAG: hypothetical protein UW55_C0033G0005 [Candidatus Giovannonibacteria bacterium GW2011_GWA2_44_26]|uniref:HIT domain-containing protein n=1 Tax=Candidatus Giovannonibacteria bacterium GW2011_GWA2_44_26 TaxID=1618648 RepID=A0A0G1LN54_9BACT|nr:MAG: hypothetical protein UW55_C0033G0005 [Candidatus Giovannonibacteria bacterium GW2011_GWA2_44_26]